MSGYRPRNRVPAAGSAWRLSEKPSDAISAMIHCSTNIKRSRAESGTTGPKLKAAIAHCKKAKARLIAKPDCVPRNLHFVAGLMESGVDFVAADNPHAPCHVISMIVAFAEDEREMISKRTRAALAAKSEDCGRIERTEHRHVAAKTMVPRDYKTRATRQRQELGGKAISETWP